MTEDVNFDASKFRIVASNEDGNETDLSPTPTPQTQFRRRDLLTSQRVSQHYDAKVVSTRTVHSTSQVGLTFLDQFLAPSCPSSQVNSPVYSNEVGAFSPASTIPNSPCLFESETPATIPSSPLIACESEYESNKEREVNVIEFHQDSIQLIETPQGTPNNTRVNNTPATSKRTTATKEISLLAHLYDPDKMPRSSLIVPVLIPNRGGILTRNDPDNEFAKLDIGYAILHSKHKDVFPDIAVEQDETKSKSGVTRDNQTREQDGTQKRVSSIERRRSVTFKVNRNASLQQTPQYLVIDRDHRTRSSDAKAQVRLLLSISELDHFENIQIHGKALKLIRFATENALKRKPVALTEHSERDFFLQNTFIAARNLTVLPAQCIQMPLMTNQGTYISVSACPNIIGGVYATGWPDSSSSRTVSIGWYDDGQPHEL